MIQDLQQGNFAVQRLEELLVSQYLYSETFVVELAFLEANDWASKNPLFTGVIGVGKILAYYDEKGNRIPV